MDFEVTLERERKPSLLPGLQGTQQVSCAAGTYRATSSVSGAYSQSTWRRIPNPSSALLTLGKYKQHPDFRFPAGSNLNVEASLHLGGSVGPDHPIFLIRTTGFPQEGSPTMNKPRRAGCTSPRGGCGPDGITVQQLEEMGQDLEGALQWGLAGGDGGRKPESP